MSDDNTIEFSLEKSVFIYESIIALSMLLNFLIIILTSILVIINLSRENDALEIPDVVNYTMTAFGFFSNILISVFGVLLSVESVNIKNIFTNDDLVKIKIIKNDEGEIINPQPPGCIFKVYYIIRDLFYNYKKTEMSFKAFKIIDQLDNIKIPESQIINLENSSKDIEEIELYNVIIQFKQIVKSNLLYRVSIGNYLNLITLIFFYFNAIMFFVPYFNQEAIKGTPKKISEIFLSILNQIFSLVFSYIAIVCENVNYLSMVCEDIDKTLRNSSLSEKKMIKVIKDHFDNVINPLNTIFKKKSDLEKEKDALEPVSSITFFGNPK